MCADVTRCGDHQWEMTPATATQDAVCRDWTLCGENSYESARGTAERDAECSPLSQCDVPNEFEAKAPTRDSDRVCKPVTPPCEVGEYWELQAPSEKGDRICQPVSPPPARASWPFTYRKAPS